MAERPFISGGAREARRDDKRHRILDAAVVEIARSGYFGTTVARIARRAGVADGTIYLYFENKDAILTAVLDRAMDRFIRQGAEAIPAAGTAPERLAAVVRQHLELVGRDHDLAVVLQVELRHSLQFMGLYSRTRLREYLGILAEVVGHGQRAGAFRADADPMDTAKLIFGVLDQTVTDWILADDNSRLASRAEPVLAFILAALRP
ncbi:TetR/AcrR family transcriptional regulator [bacterium]|nr:TetR/AcrR family transcriptional regulator [bacterium]HPF35328.1 TetR/AcrR family transcriptional regulator [Candidatus Krumholzibacteria bacterium]HRX50527.1 TetR/AcrR family transcriptional regulator [Candidatus Krumholzibacteria bacterium]